MRLRLSSTRRGVLLLSLLTVVSSCADAPEYATKRPQTRSSQTISPNPQTRQCLATLGTTKANFTPVPDEYFGGGCSTLGTVKLASLPSDTTSLALTNLGPVTCPMANAFAGWARYSVARAAQQILGSPLMRIETFGSYSCRNVAGTNRRSGHATANAIDVSAFVLADGRRISVLEDWNGGTSNERRFLRIVHESACKRFGTTLGPDYNAAHENHLHLEANGGSYCR